MTDDTNPAEKNGGTTENQTIIAYAVKQDPARARKLTDQIRPCRPDRRWMDKSQDRFAYRCVPLVAANTLGWEILNPVSCEFMWNGLSSSSDTVVRYMERGNHNNPQSHFGSGIITWYLPFLFRTPPGYGLVATGPANYIKPGIVPLEGFVRTDWLPYIFTMNWKITDPNRAIHFDKGEPICRIYPCPIDLVEDMEIEIHDIDEDPDLMRRTREWNENRAKGIEHRKENPTDFDPREVWSRSYSQGKDASGGQADDHWNVFSCKPAVDKRRKNK